MSFLSKTKKEKNMTKEKRRCASGAAFWWQPAIGPGFRLRHQNYPSDFQASFGFVILISFFGVAAVGADTPSESALGLRGQEATIKCFRTWISSCFMVVCAFHLISETLAEEPLVLTFWESQPRSGYVLQERCWQSCSPNAKGAWTHDQNLKISRSCVILLWS